MARPTKLLFFLAQLVALASPTTKCRRPHRAASDGPFVDPDERAPYDFSQLRNLWRMLLGEVRTVAKRRKPAQRDLDPWSPFARAETRACTPTAWFTFDAGKHRKNSLAAWQPDVLGRAAQSNPRSRTRSAAKARGFTAGARTELPSSGAFAPYAQKRRGALAGWRESIGIPSRSTSGR